MDTKFSTKFESSIFSFCIALGLFLQTTNIIAQSTADQQKARAYYMQAEAAYEGEEYSKTLEYLDQVAALLGGQSNATIASLRTKTLYEMKEYVQAKKALGRFFEMKPQTSLLKEMSAYLIKIDEALEKARLAEIARKEKERQAELARLEKERQEALKRQEEERKRRERARQKKLDEAFFAVVRDSDITKMDSLLSIGANPDRAYAWNGSGKAAITPLIWVIDNNKTAMAKKLLLKGASSTRTGIDNMWHPIHYAIYRNNTSVLKALLAEGADPNYDAFINREKNIWGTVLHLAIYYGHVGAVDQLLKAGARTNEGVATGRLRVDYKEYTTLEFANSLNPGIEKDIILNLLQGNQNPTAKVKYTWYKNIAEGNRKYDEKDYAGATADFDKAIFIMPDNWQAYYGKALALYYQDKFEEAILMYTAVLKRNKDYFYAYANRGLAKRLNKDYEGAIKDFKKTLDLNENYAFAYSQLGHVYLTQKKLDDAFQSFERVLSINPDDASTLNTYAWNLAINNRQLDKAEQLINRAVKIEPNNPNYLDTAGWIQFKKGNFGAASVLIEAAINSGKADAVIYRHMGDVFLKLKQPKQAKTYWQKACDMGDETACEKLESNSYTFAPDTLFSVDLVKPKIIGGIKELYEHITYPSQAIQNNIEGTVRLTFFVEPNGTASNISVINDIGGGCAEAAIAALKKVRFLPAMQSGEAVRVKFELPVTFSFE